MMRKDEVSKFVGIVESRITAAMAQFQNRVLELLASAEDKKNSVNEWFLNPENMKDLSYEQWSKLWVYKMDSIQKELSYWIRQRCDEFIVDMVCIKAFTDLRLEISEGVDEVEDDDTECIVLDDMPMLPFEEFM